jgi:hypothetical protein
MTARQRLFNGGVEPAGAGVVKPGGEGSGVGESGVGCGFRLRNGRAYGHNIVGGVRPWYVLEPSFVERTPGRVSASVIPSLNGQ